MVRKREKVKLRKRMEARGMAQALVCAMILYCRVLRR